MSWVYECETCGDTFGQSINEAIDHLEDCDDHTTIHRVRL